MAHFRNSRLLTHVFLLLMTSQGIISCKNADKKSKENTTATGLAENKHQTPQHIAFRTGIDSTNSFSDLFLDSNRVEKFIAQQHLETGKADDIRNFYNNRANQFAWFNSDGLSEQALAFRSLYDYSRDSSTSRKQLDNRLDELLNTDSLVPAADNPDIISTELSMTWRFINYLDQKYTDQKTKYAALTGLVPYQKHSLEEWLKLSTDNKALLASKNDWYDQLQTALQQIIKIKQNGGWDSIPVNTKLYTGNKTTIARLKKRLQITGQLAGNDTTASFTPALTAAIKEAQVRFGFPHDTILTTTLLKELNVPVNTRIKQILVNMERMRWMPDLPSNEYILVNIPAFVLTVKEGNSKIFDMNVIIGKDGHGTEMFSGDLNQLVFSPYWNLPESIVKKEVLKSLKKNKHYLQKHHMEITGQRNGLPVIRQLPGDWNELGKIKFLFPNSLNIYFHDTPHKWLFNKDERAYSHGCIRLAEPAKLAAYLLRDNKAWNEQKIDSAMNSGEEKYIKLAHPVPVLIYYYTAWMDPAGVIQFRKDVYEHDASLSSHLF